MCSGPLASLQGQGGVRSQLQTTEKFPVHFPFARQKLAKNMALSPPTIPPLQLSLVGSKQTRMVKNHKNSPTSQERVQIIFAYLCSKITFLLFHCY